MATQFDCEVCEEIKIRRALSNRTTELELQNAKLVEALEKIINLLHLQDGTAYDVAMEALKENNV